MVETPAPTAPSSLQGQTVWVVDANSLIFQVFHAIPEMTSPRGEPVTAVFGFTRDMLLSARAKKPDYLFVAFDRSEPTFRHELYADYKAQRTRDAGRSVAAVRRRFAGCSRRWTFRCSSARVRGRRHSGHARRIRPNELGGECYLVTGDKDCRQLISDRVKVYNVRKNQIYDAAALQADWGIRPDQVVDFQALVGDSVDNVPGVPLIGPKIAARAAGEVRHARRLARACRRAAQGQAQGQPDREPRAGAAQPQAGAARLRTCRSTSIGTAGRVGGSRSRRKLLELFDGVRLSQPAPRSSASCRSTRRPTPSGTSNYQRGRHAGEVRGVPGRAARSKPSFSFDTETTSIWPRWAEIVGYSFAWQTGEAYYLPVRAPSGEQHLDPASDARGAAAVLENPAIEKVGQNLKYDMIVLRSAGVELAGVDFDTMVASYLLDAGERNHNLDELAQRYLESHDDQDQRADRHGQEPKADGRSAGRADHALRRRRRRRGLAAAAAARSRAARSRRSTSCSNTLEDAAGRSAGRDGVQRHPDRRRRCWPS